MTTTLIIGSTDDVVPMDTQTPGKTLTKEEYLESREMMVQSYGSAKAKRDLLSAKRFKMDSSTMEELMAPVYSIC